MLAEFSDAGFPPIVREFDAKITGSAKIAGSARWRYGFVQVRRDPETDTWEEVDGGFSGTTSEFYALNREESANTATNAFGYTAEDTELTAHPEYEAFPVPTGRIVRMTLERAKDFTLCPTFDGANLIDGVCPEPESPLLSGSGDAETDALVVDITLTGADTWYDGPSVALAAGTWMVIAHATWHRSGETAAAVEAGARIVAGSTVYASVQQTTPELAEATVSLSLSAIVLLDEPTTLTLQAISSVGGAVLKARTPRNPSGDTATILSAARV